MVVCVCVFRILIWVFLVMLFVRCVLKLMGMVWLFLLSLICCEKKGCISGLLKLVKILLFFRKKVCCLGRKILKCVRLVICWFIFICEKFGLIVKFKFKVGVKVILVFIFVVRLLFVGFFVLKFLFCDIFM